MRLDGNINMFGNPPFMSLKQLPSLDGRAACAHLTVGLRFAYGNVVLSEQSQGLTLPWRPSCTKPAIVIYFLMACFNYNVYIATRVECFIGACGAYGATTGSCFAYTS